MDLKDSKNLKDLLTKSQSGDESAYRLFLSELYDISYAYLGGKVSELEIEDVLQEIIISVDLAKHTFDPRRDFHSWFYTIAKCRIADKKRKYWRTKKIKESFQDYLEINKQSQELVNDKKISEAMELLPELQRKVIELNKIKGFSYEEVAKVLGISVSNAKTSAHRGYKNLRNIIKS